MSNITDTQWTYIIPTLSNIIAKDLTKDQINFIAAILVALSDSLYLITSFNDLNKTE